eukprot:CAMPEP_0117458898 /NCGR_PEP_ID=MMETSP0784-20121206/1181_1 /TAXON_ID=39447 /ORGANISM="" /LENGTH=80 /DNA_ID=CAMNT_0005252457 /DNA_START=17 /DNA_END=255 /DNA_ORIENTATION=-
MACRYANLRGCRPLASSNTPHRHATKRASKNFFAASLGRDCGPRLKRLCRATDICRTGPERHGRRVMHMQASYGTGRVRP